MATSLFIQPFVPAVTQTNTIATGAKLFFYKTGTLISAPVYDSAGVELSNPVIADLFGRFPEIYLGFDTSYRVIMKTAAGTLLGDVDPYTPVSDPTAAVLEAEIEAVTTVVDNSVPDREKRGEFTLPAVVKFFGDSFFEQPNSHTSSGNSMAYKAAITLGVTPSISATSGNTSADKQDAIFATIPSSTDITVIGLGQNDAQFINTGADQERRLDDVALIHLANLVQISTPSGSRRQLATSLITGNTGGGSGSWTADAEIPEGGARVTHTNGDALQADIADSRYIYITFKAKNSSGGTFKVSIDGTDYYGSFDPSRGFHSAPLGNIPTNTGKTFVRQTLAFDLGRRKPLTTVQILVTSTTNVANPVSICSVIGLSGEPLAGPLAVVLDLSDRGAAGYATASGSQQNVPIISRIINQAASVVGATGGRVVPIAVSTAINPTTDLDIDQFHPNEDGANNAAAAIVAGISNAAKDWSVNRPDLFTQSLVNGANGYALLAQTPVTIDKDFLWKRKALSPRYIDWTDYVPTTASIKFVYNDGSGSFGSSDAAFLLPPTSAGDALNFGNLGSGNTVLWGNGASVVRITGTAFLPATATPTDLGTSSRPFQEVWANFVRTTPVNTVATLPTPSSAYEGARSFVEDATASTFATVVAGGGSNRVPVYCTGADWRIG